MDSFNPIRLGKLPSGEDAPVEMSGRRTEERGASVKRGKSDVEVSERKSWHAGKLKEDTGQKATKGCYAKSLIVIGLEGLKQPGV